MHAGAVPARFSKLTLWNEQCICCPEGELGKPRWDGTPSSYVTFGCHSRQLAQLMDMHVQPEGAGTDLHSCLFRDLDSWISGDACFPMVRCRVASAAADAAAMLLLWF